MAGIFEWADWPDDAWRFLLTILVDSLSLSAVKMNSTFNIQKSLCAHCAMACLPIWRSVGRTQGNVEDIF